MRTLVVCISLLLSALTLRAQSDLATVLASVGENNYTIKYLEEELRARAISNKTDIFLPNPEIGFARSWGSPVGVDNLLEFGVSQSFEMPNVYTLRRRISDMRNDQLEYEYSIAKREVELEVKLLYLHYVYYKRVQQLFGERMNMGYEVVRMLKSNHTQADSLSSEKIELEMLSLTNTVIRNDILLRESREELARLNGGEVLDLSEAAFPTFEVDEEFDVWFETMKIHSPIVALLNEELDLSEKEVKLQKAETLPNLNVGYAMETAGGETLNGVAFGVSIPLWENKNRVKAAVASHKATTLRVEEELFDLYHKLKTLHNKAMSFYRASEMCKVSRSDFDGRHIIKRTFESGEISALDYIVETGIYYDIEISYLEILYDRAVAQAELEYYLN